MSDDTANHRPTDQDPEPEGTGTITTAPLEGEPQQSQPATPFPPF